MATDVAAYSVTTWVPDAAPGISAAQLQRMDTQVGDLSTQFNLHNGGLAVNDHPEATSSARGFMSALQVQKLQSHGSVELRRDSNLNVLTGEVTPVGWAIEDRDDWGGFPGSGADIQDDTEGIYMANAMVEFASNSAGYRQIELALDGVVVGLQRVPAINGASHIVGCSWVGFMDGTQEVRVRVFQNSGVGLQVLFGVTTRFQLARIGRP